MASPCAGACARHWHLRFFGVISLLTTAATLAKRISPCLSQTSVAWGSAYFFIRKPAPDSTKRC